MNELLNGIPWEAVSPILVLQLGNYIYHVETEKNNN